MDIASKTGTPVMRPLFYDYPEDKKCFDIGDEYLFGDDIIFAPIVERGCVSRTVYLPEGEWIFTRDKSEYAGGRSYEVNANLDEYIAFVRKGAEVLNQF